MSKKRTASARRAELRRRRLAAMAERLEDAYERQLGIEIDRIRPSGGAERVDLRFRVPDEPLAALWAIQRLCDGFLADLERDAVMGLREEGFSWAEIGQQLGITGEAARQRYARFEAVESVG